MPEAKSRKKRDDDPAREQVPALYAEGLPLIGKAVEDADEHAAVVAAARFILSVPSLPAGTAGRTAALAQFEASSRYDGPETYLWDLSGNFVEIHDAQSEGTLHKITAGIHLVKTGKSREMSASWAKGGRATDMHEIRGMLRLTPAGEPFTSCDLPLGIQSDNLFAAYTKVWDEACDIGCREFCESGKEIDMAAIVEDRFAWGHLAHLDHLSSRPLKDGFSDDDAWIDAHVADRALEVIGDGRGLPPVNFVAKLIVDGARTTEILKESPIGGGIGRHLRVRPDMWHGIDDALHGDDWRQAFRAISRFEGIPAPGRSAMLLNIDLRRHRPVSTRTALLADATRVAGDGLTELFSYPDGKFLFIGEAYGRTTLVAWKPAKRPA